MSWQHLNNADRTARKEHQCIWCPEKIKAGEKYFEQSGVFEGDFQRNKYHLECWSAAAEYFDIDDLFYPHSFARGSTEEAR